MSGQISEYLQCWERVETGLIGVCRTLKSQLELKIGTGVLWISPVTVQNVCAKKEGDTDQYLALGIEYKIIPGVRAVTSGILRIDGGSKWSLSDDQLTMIGACGLRRHTLFGHPQGTILSTPEIVPTVEQ